MWPETQPTLLADGITLRPLNDDDIDRIADGCTDPAIAHFTRMPVPYMRSDAERFVCQTREQWDAHVSAAFAIAGADDLLIGACSLMDVDLVRARAEAGYWVDRDARGRGVARSALRLLTDWGHSALGLSGIFLTIEDANPASVKVAHAAGYTAEPTTHGYELKGTVREIRHHWHRR
jgi:RimJ/RimL family protein N-acetyltransferase